ILLNCWPIIILANLYFIVKITHLMDAVAGRTGAKRVRNAQRGGTPNLAARPRLGGLGSYPKGTSGCIWYGLALKMASFGIFVGEASKSGVWRRAAEGVSNWAEACGMRRLEGENIVLVLRRGKGEVVI